MIEINLLPDELKLQTKKTLQKEVGFKRIKSFLLWAIAALLAMHIGLAVWGLSRGIRLGALKREWERLTPQRKVAEEFQKEYASFSSENQSVQELIKQRINWAEKLSSLSRNLPNGIWLNEVSLANAQLQIKGSTISLIKEEINLINKFINNLKNDPAFFKDFQKLELGAITRRTIHSYEVIDFSMSGSLKNKGR